MDKQDYRKALIRNCQSIIYPTIRHEPGEALDQIDWAEAAKCAEALGKRSFMLEVMPVAVLKLVIDRSQPEKTEKKAWWKFW